MRWRVVSFNFSSVARNFVSSSSCSTFAGLATVGQEELGLQLAGDWKLDVLRRGFLEVGGEGCDSRQSVIGLTR
jgi:hypothetical protein